MFNALMVKKQFSFVVVSLYFPPAVLARVFKSRLLSTQSALIGPLTHA